MKESEFQAQIVQTAQRFGWAVWHVPAPMRWSTKEQKFVPAKSGRGLPDLILIHDDPPRLVFMEIKADGGKLSDEQQDFLQAAKRVADVAVNFPDLAIEVGTVPALEAIVGVFAVWPDDIERVEQMLRSCVVA